MNQQTNEWMNEWWITEKFSFPKKIIFSGGNGWMNEQMNERMNE